MGAILLCFAAVAAAVVDGCLWVADGHCDYDDKNGMAGYRRKAGDLDFCDLKSDYRLTCAICVDY